MKPLLYLFSGLVVALAIYLGFGKYFETPRATEQTAPTQPLKQAVQHSLPVVSKPFVAKEDSPSIPTAKPFDPQSPLAVNLSGPPSMQKQIDAIKSRRTSAYLQTRLMTPFANTVNLNVAETMGMTKSEALKLQDAFARLHKHLLADQLKRANVESKTEEELVVSIPAFAAETVRAEEQFWDEARQVINKESLDLLQSASISTLLNSLGGGRYDAKYIFSKSQNMAGLYDVSVSWKNTDENRVMNSRVLGIPREILDEQFGQLVKTGGW